MLMVSQGVADAISYISKNEEREKFALFLQHNVLSSLSLVFLINEDNRNDYIFDGDIKSFFSYPRTLVVQRGFF